MKGSICASLILSICSFLMALTLLVLHYTREEYYLEDGRVIAVSNPQKAGLIEKEDSELPDDTTSEVKTREPSNEAETEQGNDPESQTATPGQVMHNSSQSSSAEENRKSASEQSHSLQIGG